MAEFSPLLKGTVSFLSFGDALSHRFSFGSLRAGLYSADVRGTVIVGETAHKGFVLNNDPYPFLAIRVQTTFRFSFSKLSSISARLTL